ncbi:MAG: YIP1 family protein [Caulobacter sp.]|nr:YIP1 family protein [Vitreoscilla sp.]
MNLLERAKAILLKPAETWPVIDAEPASVASIYTDWLLVMAAIPAVCHFIGACLVGTGMFGFSYRTPIVSGLIMVVVGYAVSLVGFFLLSLLVNALAPTFGGTKNPVAAMKVVAYSATASCVASVLLLVPSGLLMLVLFLAGCYGIYLMYLGLPVLMKSPADKAIGYTASVIVIAFVVYLVLAGIFAALFGAAIFGAGRHAGAVSLNTPDGEVTLDTDAMSAAARRIDAARQRMEAAQKSGDAASSGAALGDMMGALTGAGGTPIPVADLKAQLPEALGALKRDSFETSGGSAMGISSSVAKATYVAGDQHAQLTISDLGGLGGLASVATWANVTVDRETPDAIEKTYKDAGRTIHEEYRKDGSHAEYTVILKNGVIVETSGDKLDGATLKAMASAINLDALEAMKRPAKS